MKQCSNISTSEPYFLVDTKVSYFRSNAFQISIYLNEIYLDEIHLDEIYLDEIYLDEIVCKIKRQFGNFLSFSFPR